MNTQNEKGARDFIPLRLIVMASHKEREAY